MSVLLLLFIISSIVHPQWDTLALATTSENDFSYMRAVSNATDLPISAVYDYIVVGGGTAGCPLAATLSQSYSVLVLERGSVPVAYPDVLRADRIVSNLAGDDDGRNPVQQFTSLDGVRNARGRILGGSSMINVGFYSRAEAEFYPKSGINWNLTLAEQAYQWVEEAIVYRSALLPWQGTFRNASLEAGIVPDNGFTLEHLVGTKLSGSTFDGLGRRHGAVELLNRGDLTRNLRVGVGATVDKILFSPRGPGLKVIGVMYRDSRRTPHWAYVRGKGEVILSAGAIGSPQLLLLSGVGPAADLLRLGIPVAQPQPNVGKFMADNTRNSVGIVSPSSLAPSYLQAVAITPDFFIESASSVMQFASLSRPSSVYPPDVSSSPVNLSLAFLSSKVPGPASTEGFLALRSPVDARVAPSVRFNYFSDPSDLAKCVKGMRKVGDLLNTNTLAGFKFDNRDVAGEKGFKFFGPSLPEDYRTNDAAVEGFCRSTITTWWHYHGGCVAGKVVDGDLRVTGIDALRVVDGSVFAVSPGTNPQATLMMMGRYFGLKIMQQRMT